WTKNEPTAAAAKVAPRRRPSVANGTEAMRIAAIPTPVMRAPPAPMPAHDGASIVPGGGGSCRPFVAPHRALRMGRDARLRRVLVCASAFAQPSARVTRHAERAVWLTAPILIAGLVHVAVITLDLAPQLARPIDA